ncbi:MAG: exodeoxyribonuclease alpha subunit [Solirubrobacterales bacterium]|nr:exodeoxyribonuclease alpha subunit [Solirubrobacterales bacterium]
MTLLAVDPFDARRALRAPELLREFNDIGVLAAADVQVAQRLATLVDEPDERVVLAAALAVRAPRIGHVYVDLATIRDTASVDTEEPVDLSELPWPEADGWVRQLAASELVAVGEDDVEAGTARPLRLVGSWLYLDRYWQEERRVATDLLAISDEPTAGVSMGVLADGLARMFEGETASRQCLAAASAVLRRFAVVAGGPGTGKTTTVARIVALLAEQAAHSGSPPPLVALAAPTGKAAARLEEAVHEEAAKLPVTEPIRAGLLALQASTLHRLLGWRPGSHSRFRHHRGQRLPHDVVIVDETSMVSLSLMARLAEAVRPDARLILVGDPAQLASIEAGAVLGDIVGPATDRPLMTRPARLRLAEATGHEITANDPPGEARIGDGIIVLDRVHRFGTGIARLASAIHHGDSDAALKALEDSPHDVLWIPIDVAEEATDAALATVRDGAVTAARAVMEAARAGAASEAIAALASYRLLCAHRRGPYGVTTWTARIEGWLATALNDFTTDDRWYIGRPLLVTDNDYELQLYNGDTGVVVQSTPERASAAFERRGEVVEFSPTRLGSVETVYAMTIHKSQGSQFETAAVLLPASTSRVLTRELLYTAATRARKRLVVVGSAEAIATAVKRPVARASGLRRRLWGN